jgi:hypothetical protein
VNGQAKTDWPGYLLVPTGLNPWYKMIQADMALQACSKIKLICVFLDTFNYHHGMRLCL